MKNQKLQAILLAVAIVGELLLPLSAQAAPITNRSITMGSSAPGIVTQHKYDFTIPTASTVGSIAFQYCTTSSGACTTPTGLVTTGATLIGQTGVTGFTQNNTTNGTPYITRAPAGVGAGVVVSYTLGVITNPTTANTEFWVRIATYASIDTTGGSTDTGVVAFDTANDIVVSGVMPESLVFCVGTSGTDCTNITGSAVSLGTFSPLTPVVGTSVMSASTNASFGYSITVAGTTLMSGANTIPSMGTQTLNSVNAVGSSVGTSQFGINLRANNVAPVGVFGADVSGLGSGIALNGYSTSNIFRYFTGDNVGSASGPTKTNTYTTSYIVNVSPDQAAGVYTSTFTYTCTALF